ncbi:MAG: hypothetical protein GY810_22550 [Aureispira sp.]|nr:hypothetical protein [Aureispira sp.]
MRSLFFTLIIIGFLGMGNKGMAQNKIKDDLLTFRDMCFFTINKEKFDQFLRIQKAIADENYILTYSVIQEMRKNLKHFDIKNYDRTFEFWYSANYIDFDKQLQVAKESTLNALNNYEKRIRNNNALYFDHRMFLMHYLAYLTESFYPDFWFMSMERFFSKDMVHRIKRDNPEEGPNLFKYSDLYTTFEQFDAMIEHEEKEMKRYLGIDKIEEDTSGIAKKPLIPYSYGLISRQEATHLLESFKLDDATQDINTDREVRAFKRFLQRARAGKIYLVARFDTIPYHSKKGE